jgi:hypothetical protein
MGDGLHERFCRGVAERTNRCSNAIHAPVALSDEAPDELQRGRERAIKGELAGSK